jgi:hypothetical protein
MLARFRGMMDEARLRGRRLRGRTLGAQARMRDDEVWLTLPDGYRVYLHVHGPAGDEPLPAVLLVPGLEGSGTSFDKLSAIVSADEIASLGCVCAHFDPPGIGRSWGTYDYGGPSCQAATLAALDFLARCPRFDGGRLGVLAISLGVAAVMPVVAEHGVRLGVDWVLDWEGPGDRQVITSFGTIMKPAMGHGLDDEGYWGMREAVRHVSGLRCRYLREQARVDHAQGEYTTHAIEMVNAAVDGGCPDVWLNGVEVRRPIGPRGLADVRWRVEGKRAACGILMDAVEQQLSL